MLDVQHRHRLVLKQVVESYITKKEGGGISLLIFVQIEGDIRGHQGWQMDNTEWDIRVLCVCWDKEKAVLHKFLEDVHKVHFWARN